MISINLVCVGNLKEKFWLDAQNEYIKRLQAFCKISVIEVPEFNGISEGESQLKEGKKIIEKLKGSCFVFDVNGESFSSEDLAKLIKSESLSSSTLTFVIGGSVGVSEEVKSEAKKLISFGKITLPHNLARVVALEQIYRAMMINSGRKYHK